MKRFVSMVLSTLLVFSIAAPSAFAAGGAQESSATPEAASLASSSIAVSADSTATPTPKPVPKPKPKPVYKKVVGYTSSTSKRTQVYASPDKKAKVIATFKTVKRITFTETGKSGWYTAKVKVGKKTKTGYFRNSQIDWPVKKAKNRKQVNMIYNMKVYKSPTSTKVIKTIPMLSKTSVKSFTGQWNKMTVKVKSGKKKTKKVTGYVKTADLDYSKKFLKKKTAWILIDQSSFKLTLYKGNKVSKKYGCTLGMKGHSTPNGNFRVELKRYMPTWGNPDKSGWGANMPDTIAPGPNNPLGLRALNINSPGIRIHGSARPMIGTRSSHGCIRLTNKNVVDLYNRVKVGTQVVIRP